MKLLSLGLLTFSASLSALPALNLNIDKVTVSGLSSGGYMANQFHIAHSDWVEGAAVIAAGPYYCAQNSLLTALGQCVNKQDAPIELSTLNARIKEWEKNAEIAPLENLKSSRVWLLHGSEDSKVIAPVTDTLARQYAALVPESQYRYIKDKAFAHHFPTLERGADCKTSTPPYLGACGYDAAGELLGFLLGKLTPPSQSISGKLVELDQQALAPKTAATLAEKGYAYIPDSCAKGETCRLHINFHGCNQYAEAENVGTQYMEGNGLNRWADTNHLVVLYPQTKASMVNPLNPQGCWDWWGYTDEHYATRSGQQIRAVADIAHALAGK